MKELSWAACLRLGVTAAAVYLVCAGQETLRALTGAISPLLYGGGVACMVNIPMSAMERRIFPHGGRFGRGLCLTASLAGAAAAAAWLAWVILPELIRCAALLAAEMPELLGGIAAWLDDTGAAAWLRTAGLPDWQTLLQRGLNASLESAGGVLRSTADALSALTTGAANALLSLIIAAYCLAGKERLQAQLSRLTQRLLGERALCSITGVLRALYDAFCTYVKGQCIEALLLGCLCLLGMTALRLPQALTISAMAGASALIPMVGAPIAAAAGAALLVPSGAAEALRFAVFFLLLQQAESNLIYPRIVSSTLGLTPLWTLAAMVTGGGLFGLTGAVLAVPAAAAARTLLSEMHPAPR